MVEGTADLVGRMSGIDRKYFTLLHISDIHFREGISGTAHDPHATARHELIRDAQSLAGSHGPIDIVVVSGDIAHGGKKEEYTLATKWLTQLCRAIGRDLGIVLTVPGNHDVDCNTIQQNPMIAGAQASLRGANDDTRDAVARDYLLHRESVAMLLRPHYAYNEFAAQFECHVALPPGEHQVDAPPLYWERNFPLNDGSTLRIRGMTSTLCSDYRIGDSYGKVFVSRNQYQFYREPHVIHVAVCHYPPEWTSTPDQIEDALHATRLQLFGHKHRLRPIQVGTAIRIGAGTVQPEGDNEDHLRGYSLVKLRVDGSGNHRKLNVDILPRRWASQPPWRFEAERNEQNAEIWNFQFLLGEWTPPPLTEDQPVVTARPNQNDDQVGSEPASVERDPGGETRALFIRFFALPYSRRFEACGKLNLIRDEDGELPDYEKFVVALRRAIDGGRSNELTSVISEMEQRNP